MTFSGLRLLPALIIEHFLLSYEDKKNENEQGVSSQIGEFVLRNKTRKEQAVQNVLICV